MVGVKVNKQAGFTLVEILASTALLAILMLILASVADNVQRTYRQTEGKAEQFREARAAFESITRRLSSATLNTYWAYDDPSDPSRYLRLSELRFKSGNHNDLLPTAINSQTHAIFFHAPIGLTSDPVLAGMEALVNTWGYYIEFGGDSQRRPDVVNDAGIPERFRFRLLEMMEPAEELTVYQHTSGLDASGDLLTESYRGLEWFQNPLGRQPLRSSRVLAENIVALIFLPRDPENAALTTDFGYDSSPDQNPGSQSFSEHQLPPFIQVIMVAIDETSALRLAAQYGTTMPPILNDDWFRNPANLDADLDALRAEFASENINYRIFTSNVPIRGAKWSS